MAKEKEFDSAMFVKKRRDKGLTQFDITEDTGIKLEDIKAIEEGILIPTKDIVEKLKKVIA